MPDNPLVGWLTALASGAPHPWRESLAGGQQHATTSTTSTTLPRELLAALQAEREPLSAERSQAIEAMLADAARQNAGPGPERGESFRDQTERYRRWYMEQQRLTREPPGAKRADRIATGLDRLVEEGKLILDENKRARWSPDYFPTRDEARSVGTAFLHDMIGWGADEDAHPPDPYRAGWQFNGGWHPPGYRNEPGGYRPQPRGTRP